MYAKYVVSTFFAVIVVGLLLYSGGYFSTSASSQNATNVEKDGLSWQENECSLSLVNNGEVVWRLNYDKSQDKPYFYPLRTLVGTELALQRPADHPWHRGLWFSWKEINALNYWEEDPDKGVAPGRTLIRDVETEARDDHSATVSFQLDYSPNGQHAILEERRTITVSAPDGEGNYRIDWELQFTAGDGEIFLDRVLPQKHGGVSWGGYAGLGFRANDIELDSIRYLDSNGWSRSESLTGYGEGANWMDLSGTAVAAPHNAAGLTIFDHPSNPRHPSPWYVWYQEGEHAFFMPAFLYDEPFKLPAGETFTLRYRVLVHEGAGTFATLNDEYEAYSQK